MPTLPLISHLRLPFTFDVDALQQDLSTIAAHHWRPQLYTMNYEGEWTSLALLAPDGENDTFSHADARVNMLATAVLEQCPYFQQVLDQFQCPLLSARLLRLQAGAIIKPHQDFRLGYENHNFRIHIPITTHEKVEFILAGERLSMQAGSCWYTNVNYTHSVANRGTEDRIHLVIDGERNDWSDQLFFSLAPRDRFGLEEEYEQETTRRVIEELRQLNSPAAREAIQELEGKLKGYKYANDRDVG